MHGVFKQAAPIGHNSHAEEIQRNIKRTAKEILEAAERARAKSFDPASWDGEVRLEYLKEWTNTKFPLVVRLLNAASLSNDITGDEFKKMYVLSRLGGGKAEDIEIENEILAILMHTDTRGWRKAKGGLEAKGWLTARPTYRRRDGGRSVNAYSLKNPVLALLEKLETMLSGVEIREGQANPPPRGSNEPSPPGQANPPPRVERTPQEGGSNGPPFPGESWTESWNTHPNPLTRKAASMPCVCEGASLSQEGKVNGIAYPANPAPAERPQGGFQEGKLNGVPLQTKAASAARPKKTRLPADWKPSEQDRAFAIEKGLTGEQIDRLAEGFADYWRSSDAKGGGFKSDWSATFRDRVRVCIDSGRLPKTSKAEQEKQERIAKMRRDRDRARAKGPAELADQRRRKKTLCPECLEAATEENRIWSQQWKEQEQERRRQREERIRIEEEELEALEAKLSLEGEERVRFYELLSQRLARNSHW